MNWNWLPWKKHPEKKATSKKARVFWEGKTVDGHLVGGDESIGTATRKSQILLANGGMVTSWRRYKEGEPTPSPEEVIEEVAKEITDTVTLFDGKENE